MALHKQLIRLQPHGRVYQSLETEFYLKLTKDSHIYPKDVEYLLVYHSLFQSQ